MHSESLPIDGEAMDSNKDENHMERESCPNNSNTAEKIDKKVNLLENKVIIITLDTPGIIQWMPIINIA